ncbi:multidrug effflux MFS transporter [Anianabacter salinae]|uniref:multidrug effflux MFS transporter n=1 Tax=Anianabacter salinae TaxID=2851023 RepID=UPI00225E5E78|nr:multidrug effflux MFS transporter [Anianabacter salinae]MBV0912136.1 multidrug effflux MFS transporter [Anianabacter salinae]
MSPSPLPQPKKQLSQAEFIAVMAMMFATIAFSVDAMLPAFPGIVAELTPDDPNRVQLMITSFILGMGVGTLFTGPLSDTFGRKPIIIFGALVYCVGAALAWIAPSLELILVARVLQGLGAAGPRVVALAIVRDLYSGRKMAKIVSFIMMIFTLFPAFAPLIGSGIIAVTGTWRAIFGAFLVFSLISVTWITLRQAETLPADKRRAFRPAILREGVVEVLTNRRSVTTIIAITMVFAALFLAISATQLIFDRTYGMNDVFPYWFAGIALLAATGSILNSQIVEKMGMRRVVSISLTVALVISVVATATWSAAGAWSFWIYIVWTQCLFYMVQLTVGNLNALAMEPLGHLAGMAASIIGAISTVVAVILAAPISLLFDGTPVPIMAGTTVLILAALLLVRRIGDVPETESEAT